MKQIWILEIITDGNKYSVSDVIDYLKKNGIKVKIKSVFKEKYK